MKKYLKYCMLLGLIGLGLSCSNNPDEEPQPPMPPEEPEVSFMDTATLAEVVLNLQVYIPTWEELKRFTDTAERIAIPAFEKRALGWAGLDSNDPTFDVSQPWMPQVQDYDQGLVDRFGANMSSSIMSFLPPFSNDDGSNFTYPIPLNVLDKKLRATTVYFLYEKSLGRATTFVQFYPPDQESELFETRQEFEAWFEGIFLPEKVAEAKAAELMKAEKLMPWPLELEVLTGDLGGIGNGGFLEDASKEELMEFANSFKDRVLAAVKQHYNGKIVAHLYNNYFMRPEAHFWDEMTYEGFDEIHFAFFPNFDVETTKLMMDEQLIHYTKIIQNSGNIPWIASEVSAFEWYFQNGDLETIEKELYEAVFQKLESAPIPPKGISAAGGYMKTDAAKDYVRDYFATH